MKTESGIAHAGRQRCRFVGWTHPMERAASLDAQASTAASKITRFARHRSSLCRVPQGALAFTR